MQEIFWYASLFSGISAFFALSFLVFVFHAHFKSTGIVLGCYLFFVVLAHIIFIEKIACIPGGGTAIMVLIVTLPISLCGALVVILESILIRSVRRFLSKSLVVFIALILLLFALFSFQLAESYVQKKDVYLKKFWEKVPLCSQGHDAEGRCRQEYTPQSP